MLFIPKSAWLCILFKSKLALPQNKNIIHVSAYITCPDANDNATVSDWSGVVMAWTVSLVRGQFRAHHIDCV